MSADLQLEAQARLLGFPLALPIQVGGHYSAALRDGDLIHVSGQIPRMGDAILVVGTVGAEVGFDQACCAAQVGTQRALCLVRQMCGTLEAVVRVPRMGVYIRSAPGFTRHSEVADAASHLLTDVLGPQHGAHSRTSVGVAQLPKGAAVEIEFVFRVRD